MKTIVTQAMHPQHSNGRWINIPADMKKQYDRLGWNTRELVDRADAEREIAAGGQLEAA